MNTKLKGQFIKHKRVKDVCYLVKDIKRFNGTTTYKMQIWNISGDEAKYLQDCKAEDLALENFEFTNYSSYSKGNLRYANWMDISK